jgi:hypothetical protein
MVSVRVVTGGLVEPGEEAVTLGLRLVPRRVLVDRRLRQPQLDGVRARVEGGREFHRQLLVLRQWRGADAGTPGQLAVSLVIRLALIAHFTFPLGDISG